MRTPRIVPAWVPLGLAGLLAAAWLVTARAPTAHADSDRELVLDVEDLVGTFNFAPAATQTGGPIPDGPFQVTGKIYPGGTLNADGSVPAGAVPIGTWFCTGFVNGSIYTSTDVFRVDGVRQIVDGCADQGGERRHRPLPRCQRRGGVGPPQPAGEPELQGAIQLRPELIPRRVPNWKPAILPS